MATLCDICSTGSMPSLSELGEDLAGLVRAFGSPLASVTALSRRGEQNEATAFQLRFADGSTLKGSRMRNADKTAEVAAVVADLGEIVPRIISWGGTALLSEWVEGETLAAAGFSEAQLRRCGAAQARVHIRVVADADSPTAAVARWRRNSLQVLGDLGAAAVLTPDEVAQLGELLQRRGPASCAIGVSLGDYCPENIVCRADGEPCLIDLETLSIAPCDYDLGRTWYRWPMSASQRAAYLDGYAAHRDPAAFLAHRPFWVTAGLIQSAWFRYRFRRGELPLPVAELRAVLRDDVGA